nr:MAG TPA: hypothetical protein [Caudoviricetes sp.]
MFVTTGFQLNYMLFFHSKKRPIPQEQLYCFN